MAEAHAADLDRARQDAARERDELRQAFAAQIAVLESAREDLRARAEYAEADSQRTRAEAGTARDERDAARAANTTALALCERALRDGGDPELLAQAAEALRAAAPGPATTPPPSPPRRGRRTS
jgi:hypothetical protein